VFLWWCLCVDVVVFLCFCGGVFVVVFLWWCLCVDVVVFLWFCGCVFVFLVWWLCFWVFVVVWLCFWVFSGGVVVSLCWCGCVLCFCAFVARSVGGKCWRRELGESVVEGCCREVLEKRVGMCCRVWEVLDTRVVEKLRRVL